MNGASSLDLNWCSFRQPTTAPTVLVILDGTDLATLPSQCWLTRLARKMPQNKVETGRGAGTGHFQLGCEVSQLNLTRTVGRTSLSIFKLLQIYLGTFKFDF